MTPGTALTPVSGILSGVILNGNTRSFATTATGWAAAPLHWNKDGATVRSRVVEILAERTHHCRVYLG